MNSKELYGNILRKRSFLCVGLDSDPSLFPAHLNSYENPIFEFNKAIIVKYSSTRFIVLKQEQKFNP